MSLKAGDWYQNPLSVARRVSAVLGLQGRAVYDALCSYADNDTGETTATAETIAAEFQMSAAHARRIIRDLRNIRAIVIVTRGDEKAYRINREHPESLLIEQESREHGCAPRAPMRTVSTGARAPVIATRTDDQRNKEELDLKSKPTRTQVGLITHTEPPTPTPPPFDGFDRSLIDQATNAFMVHHRVRGSHWLKIIPGCISDTVTEKHLPPIRAQDFMNERWHQFVALGGEDTPKRMWLFFADNLQLKPESSWGICGTEQNNRHQPARSNSAQARRLAALYAASEEPADVAD